MVKEKWLYFLRGKEKKIFLGGSKHLKKGSTQGTSKGNLKAGWGQCWKPKIDAIERLK